MPYPDFFEQIPSIRLRDPLAEFLGSAHGGILEYSYTDVVKLTGHSCPTVAGAWLMTTGALKRLYGEQLPVRGNIVVRVRNGPAEGVTGVIASVAGFITGAAGETGFKGLRGQFERRDLLRFDQAIGGDLRFERLDTGAGVTVGYNAAVVPPPPNLMPQLLDALSPGATVQVRAAFAQSWQARVRAIIEHAGHPQLLQYS